MSKPPSTPRPTFGVISALLSGFEAVNARPWLVLVPLALDLFLWLGPHLSLVPLIRATVAMLQRELPNANLPADQMQVWTAFQATLTDYAARFNLFSALSTAPLGVPSLLAARAPSASPLGPPTLWLVTDPGLYLLGLLGLSLAGTWLGALYFGALAQQVRETTVNVVQLAREVWGHWARLTALALAGWIVLLVLSLPVLLIVLLLAALNPLLGSIAMLIGFTAVFWIVFYLALTVPGLFVQKRGLFSAIWESAVLVQLNYPTAASLCFAVLVVNFGLAWLWNIPTDESWWLAVGVGGHAIVVTALVAAIFAFYQDRYQQWIELRATAAAKPKAV